jgi:hypothetical protein
MKLSMALLVGMVAVSAPQALGAQARDRDGIPAASRPPAGMCRIWLEGVPAAQQPAPTDCATAVRNRPAKARVIFGDDYATPRREPVVRDTPPVKGLAPTKTDEKRKPPIQLRRP